MPIAVLNAMAARADRVLARRALAMLPATMAPNMIKEEDRRRLIASLERRAGHYGRTRRGDVERIVAGLGMELSGSR